MLVLIIGELLLRAGLGGPPDSAGEQRDLQDQLEASRKAELGEAQGAFSLFGLVQASAHPDVVFELKPNLVGTFRGEPVRISAEGLREDREYGRKKPAGTYRIVGIGDSHMFGWGISQGQDFLALLEESLNRDSPVAVEVLNFAVPGYNAAMEVAALEHRALAYDPDLIVIHFVGNDMELPQFMQPSPSTPLRMRMGWLGDLRLAHLLSNALAKPADDVLVRRDRAEEEIRDAASAQYTDMLGLEGYRRAMARLADVSAERSIPVVMLVLGTKGRRAIPTGEAARHGFILVDAHPCFVDYLEQEGIGWDQFSPTFKVRGDGHPNATAHRQYAKCLHQAVRARIQP